MNASNEIGLVLITIALVGLVALIMYRRDRRANLPIREAAVTVPPPPLSESERLEKFCGRWTSTPTIALGVLRSFYSSCRCFGD